MITCNVPGALMQADMDELVHLKMEGKIVKLLIKVNESYAADMAYEQGNPVICTELNKALYGTLLPTLLSWK